MKKQTPKLTLSRETLRNLDATELGNALGGAINVRSQVEECTQPSIGCSGDSTC